MEQKPQTPTEPPQSTIIKTPKPEIPTPQNPNPKPNPTPTPTPTPNVQTQPRPTQQPQQQVINRARPPYTTQYSPSLSSTTSTASTTTTSLQRSGVAIGVPAHQPRPQQPAPFTTAYGPAASLYAPAQVKQNIQGIQTIGNFGSLTAVRPAGVPQQRSPIPVLRPQTTATNQTLVANQNKIDLFFVLAEASRSSSESSVYEFSKHSITRYTTRLSKSKSAVDDGPVPGKQMHPPLASTSYRQQTRPQTLQQRTHHPQQQHPMTTVSHQQMASSQQPMSQLHQSQEVYGQQHAVTRVTQSMPHPQQGQRVLGPLNQKTPGTTVQAGPVQSGAPNTTSIVDAGESSNHILSKRSIHELVSQIDPSEKLDPEVEDILMEIAEDFVDSSRAAQFRHLVKQFRAMLPSFVNSYWIIFCIMLFHSGSDFILITAVGCSLAKHRKSTTLEAKDILLHLERNWHMTLPGFGADEIKGYKKQHTNDIHKERLAVIKKSMVSADTVNMKNSAGQAAGNFKGHAAKAPTTGSLKVHEVLSAN
ncbi:hypothetical protein IFM89_036517 [Coptis chinensis]|uniref:Transcription initiation factor TFIID subunit 12 domain-containing protein n=1 Tax=Coptis chinensis TaxID=261450 RepID=A0A835LGU5_9MAGN|nr:hypothetical protein IFM89_036517 [Coptis chinensis]